MTQKFSSSDLKGILHLIPATFSLCLMNALGKYALAFVPVFTLMFFRTGYGLPIAWFLAKRKNIKLKLLSAQPLHHLSRAIYGIISISLFFLSTRYIPLSNAIALNLLSPFFATILSAILLKEIVAPRRWLVVCTGFIAVLMIEPPVAGTNMTGLACGTLGAVFNAMAWITVRRLTSKHDVEAVVFYYSFWGVILMAPVLFFSPFPYNPGLLLALFAVGAVGTLYQFLNSTAYSLAPVSTLAPYSYLSLIWGSILGFAIWHEIPEPMAVLGMILLALGGVFLIRTERKKVTEELPLA